MPTKDRRYRRHHEDSSPVSSDSSSREGSPEPYGSRRKEKRRAERDGDRRAREGRHRVQSRGRDR